MKSDELLKAVERIRKDVKRRNKMLPNKPFNQPIARSQANSGTELDECCESSFNQEAGHAAGQALDQSNIPQAEAGKGLNRALRAGDGRKR
jgi:hypothetical protein